VEPQNEFGAIEDMVFFIFRQDGKCLIKNIFSPFLEKCGRGRGGLWDKPRIAFTE
jgi:hypothetical protein